MADQPTGRARGRARGRSRGQPTEQLRRPGQPEPGQTPVGMPAAAAAAVVAPASQQAAPAGRATHRGGGVRGPNGSGAAAVTTAMQQMNIAEGGSGEPTRGGMAGRGVPRGRRDEDDIVATRPAHVTDKKGTSGTAIDLLANYFPIISTPDATLFHYHVDFAPEIDSRAMRKGLLKVHKHVFGETYNFDGMALFCTRKMQHEITELTSQRLTDGAPITISLKFTREVHRNDPVIIQLLNLQQRNNFYSEQFKLMGRNFYDMHSAASVPQHNIELWPGFVTSIRQHERELLMCVDPSFKILRKDNVLEVLYALYQKDSRNHQDAAAKQLIGCTVVTRYNNKTYRVDEIDWQSNPLKTFTMKDGSAVSYVDYYKQHWKINIEDMMQPLLVSLPSASDRRRGQITPNSLIPELCSMTGLTDDMKADFNVMRDIAVHTRVGPDKRVESLLKFMGRMRGNPKIQQEMKGWGTEYGTNLIKLQGRLLPPEKILQKNFNIDYKPASADWTAGMRGKPLTSAVPLERWVVVVTHRDAGKARDLADTMAKVGPPMGMFVTQPRIIEINDDKTTTFIAALQQVIAPTLQLVMVIVPNNRKDRYDAIKRICVLERPIASQVVVARTLMKSQMMMSVATKIAIQINCKLGGEAWCVEVPLKNLMVIGYDSYHDSSKRGSSVGGVVCTMNPTLTRYYSGCTFQSTHTELLDALKVQVSQALKNYHRVNGTLPERIIIYRDGVGDGQIAQVKEWEVDQLHSCFAAMGDYKPKLTFIIVNKRINTRFFAKSRNIENPPPGTVVDDIVTRPERFDFFLVSQSVRQGTVSPTQYNVIYDTSGLRPDHIQRLSYKMTHLYYNWPGTIRVPAPCQYAHKLAFLVGQSLHKPPHEDHATQLYYL